VQLIFELWLLATLFNEFAHCIVLRCVKPFEAFRIVEDEHVIIWGDDLVLNIVFAGTFMLHTL
jgi:hypothetical protein